MEFKLNRIKNIALLFVLSLLLSACGGAPGSDDDSGSTGSTGGTPGQVVSEITLTLGATTVAANGTDTLAVRATVEDQDGVAISGATVSFTSSLGTLSSATATTDVNGFAQVILTAGTVAGTSAVMVSSSGFNASGDVTFTSTSGGGSGGGSDQLVSEVRLTFGASSIIANGTDVLAVRATVVDQDGVVISGETVSFTSSLGVLSAATATTDANGIAQVTLTAGTVGGTSAIMVSASGFNASGNVTFTGGSGGGSDQLVSAITLILGATSVVANGTDTLAVRATVADQDGDAISGETVSFTSSLGALSAATATTDANGVAQVTLTTGSVEGTSAITVSASGFNAGANVVFTSSSSETLVVGNIVLTLGAGSIIANGTDTVAVRATVEDQNDSSLEGATVTFSSTYGTLSTATAVTDASGIAQVMLTPGLVPAVALLSASTSGFSDSVSLPFVAGPPSVASSLIAGSPSSVPADGASNSVVTVLLIDTNGNLVADGTSVTLQTTAGTITSDSTTTTTSGRANFTLEASSSSETANLSLSQFPGITGSVEFGATGTGTATSTSTTIANNFLTISGVGGVDNTSITITVTDDSGVLITDPVGDNIRISFLTSPGGGEFISVDGGSSETTIDTQTESGAVTLNLQAGILPGAVELQILVDSTGLFTSPEVTALIPQVSIASGPPATIVLSTPITNSIENLGGGFYRRSGTLIVTDRFGNAVPDGTAINLGIVDSVIVSSDSGALTAGTLTDTSPTFADLTAIADFSTASIVRNSSNRFIEQGDRVLITDVIDSPDKVRFVGASVGTTTVDVQADFVGTDTALTYVIGAAMLGAEISGLDGSGTLTTGSVQTTNGLANIRVTYPANVNTIRLGCFDSPDDTRYLPNDSAQIYMIASATSGSATLVDRQTLCFSPIADFTIVADLDTVSSSDTVTLTLRDGGDTVLLPFYQINCSVTIQTNGAGGFSVSATSGPTNAAGQFTTAITVAGGVSNDRGTVTCADFAGEDSIDITVDIP